MHAKEPIAKAVLVTGSTIGVIVLGLFFLASLVTGLLGLASRLDLHPALRLGGAVIFVAGLGLALWLFRYRSPSTMIVSTYFTFLKMFARVPVSRLEGRTEPLVVGGPQRYVRHPLYLGALTMFLGWAILTGSTSSLIAVVFILLWFGLVQIPFEEKELHAIFGEKYARVTPARFRCLSHSASDVIRVNPLADGVRQAASYGLRNVAFTAFAMLRLALHVPVHIRE